MVKVFLGVGSNLGEKEKNISEALFEIKKNKKISFVKSSPVYETEPVGGPPHQEKYLNVVWEIETGLSPEDLLEAILSVEQKLGRERSEKNAPRTMDIDILFYEDQIIQKTGLQVPHPRLHERQFILKPLCDLIPDKKHPVLNKTLRELMEGLHERN